MTLEKSNYYHGRFSVAPMLDWTTRHCRYFHRQFSRYARLYTEMVTTGAIIHASYDHLEYSDEEHPLALQLGGSDPEQLAQCAKLAVARGYDEINLNVGCPSDRVQNGFFGACLMAKKELVGESVSAMQRAVDIPVTVKTRIGIDDFDSYEFLCEFVQAVAAAGCQEFIIHARKAWLSGLSPKQNREIPPLNYERVYQLKQDFPQLKIAINGGIKTIEEMQQHLQHVDGVMVGREAYHNPGLLGYVDQQLFNRHSEIVTPYQAVQKMLPYIEEQLSAGVHLNHMVRPMISAFHGCKGAKQWRRYLSENAHKSGADVSVVETALQFISQ